MLCANSYQVLMLENMLVDNALASVYSFRTMVHPMYGYVFGIRMGSDCPDCNKGKGDTPRQYDFGSYAKAEVCIVGCIDAAYTSIEAQNRTGSLHAHSAMFVQCLHQHTYLHDHLNLSRKDAGTIMKQYLHHESHVSSECFEGSTDTLRT